MASGSGWNLWVWLAGGGCGWSLWVWLVGVVVTRYIDFLILLIPTPLVSVLFLQQHPYFLIILNMFFILFPENFCNLCKKYFAQYKHTYGRLVTMGLPRKLYEEMHIMFFTRRSRHKHTLHILRWTSAV